MRKALLFILACAFIIHGQPKSKLPWKGNAILGNGNVCLVYSDDPRISVRSKASGVQHYYVGNYTMDYINGSSFRLLSPKGDIIQPVEPDSISMDPFYKTLTMRRYTAKLKVETNCYVHPGDVTIIDYKCAAPKISMETVINLRRLFVSDKQTRLVSLENREKYTAAKWENGTVLVFASSNPKSTYSASDSSVRIVIPLAGPEKKSIFISPGKTESEAYAKIKKLLTVNYARQADTYWRKWIERGLPGNERNDSLSQAFVEPFKRTMYSVKAATINGQIPADMTGQFVTNNMPQLYPRDAMKTARVFLQTGYLDEAADIISFWCGTAIPRKSKGEFYARYDAFAKAVDGGSGARYDEPEWDANGYLIQLLNQYNEITGKWLADKEFVYELADFLVSKIDSTGLLYEGGIVEWTAYLPTTNMICSAGLSTAASIARRFGDSLKAAGYEAAAKVIADNLYKTYDLERNTYAAVRFHGVKDGNSSISDQLGEKVFLWDGTMQFGYLWGYPLHPMLESTINFYEQNLITKSGGMQYFEAMDNGGLSAYGGDMFFFTTASLARYYCMHPVKYNKALPLINWMIKNANVYGLMPERIYLNESDCSDASPLSWCNAEFAAAVHAYFHR